MKAAEGGISNQVLQRSLKVHESTCVLLALCCTASQVYPAVRIQYKWPVGGSTDDAVNITVSTSMPELLAEPRVGEWWPGGACPEPDLLVAV